MKLNLELFSRKEFANLARSSKSAREGSFLFFTPEFHACLQIHQKRIGPEPFLPQELHPQCR